jgi:hypothetical protein
MRKMGTSVDGERFQNWTATPLDLFSPYYWSKGKWNIVDDILFYCISSLLQTLCFHLGMIEFFIYDYDVKELRRRTDWDETQRILEEIHHEFVKDNGAIQYSHKVFL